MYQVRPHTRNELIPGTVPREERAAIERRLGNRVEASQGPPELRQHVYPLYACEFDRERGDSRHLCHHNVFDVVMPAVSKHVWDHDVWVSGKLMQEERLFFQTGAGTQAISPASP